MKNLFLTFAVVLLSITMSFAESLPTEVKLIENKVVSVTIEEYQTDFFKMAEYDNQKELLEFVTKSDIAYIQIFDSEGNLEFQLPVMSNKVFLSKNLFDSGAYKLGFMIEGKSTIEFTDVMIF